MAKIIADLYASCLKANAPTQHVRNFREISQSLVPTVPSGGLRIGGDSPDGLVLVDEVPSARIVDVFTRDTVNDPPVLLHVFRTTSAGDGTYDLTGLAARTEGYDVCIRGVIASGERDVWIPGVHPG